MQIVTGATGTPHITSNQDGGFNQGIFGNGCVILATGGQLEATIIDNNTVQIADGDIVFQGRHAVISAGTTENMSIATGASGRNRKDLICVRYENDGGVEEMTLVVKQGTASTGTPSDPSYTTGIIRTGSVLAEYPIYRVNISGINITSVEQLVDVCPFVIDIAKKKIDYGTSLPSANNYNEGDIFLLYE